MNQKYFIVIETTENTRADKFIFELLQEHEHLSHLSRSQIQRMIEEEHIKVNSKPIRSKDILESGMTLEVLLPEPKNLNVIAENIPLHILYEDEHLVVVNKQPGLTVHPSDTQASGTLVNALLYHIKDLSGIGGVYRPGIVHRIDKNTSGALVVSKTDAAHLGLSKLFSSHTIERKYWAFIYGTINTPSPFKVETTLGRNPNNRKKMAVNVEGGRNAISHFSILESYAQPAKNAFAAFVEAKLETGRTHQVRVHLNHLGHSILGDTVYGTPTDSQTKFKILPNEIQAAVKNLPGQALHARVLGFKHPITGRDLHFEAEPFEAFQRLATTLHEFK